MCNMTASNDICGTYDNILAHLIQASFQFIPRNFLDTRTQTSTSQLPFLLNIVNITRYSQNIGQIHHHHARRKCKRSFFIPAPVTSHIPNTHHSNSPAPQFLACPSKLSTIAHWTQVATNSHTYKQSCSNHDHVQLQLSLTTACHRNFERLNRSAAPLYSSQPTQSLWAHRTTMIGSSNTIETQLGRGVLVLLVLLVCHSQTEFERCGNVSFAVNAITIQQLTKQKREEFRYKIPFLLHRIHYTKV